MIYLVFSLLTHAGGEPLTVSGLKLEESASGRMARVEGKVAPGSVDWNGESNILKFRLTDNVESLDVVYTGVIPDNFRPGTELVVVGNYGVDGVFTASDLGSSSSWCGACH